MKNYCGTLELRWSAYLGQRENTAQDSRARLAGRARLGMVRCPRFAVFGTSNPKLRTSGRAFLACLALPALRFWMLADFFSILLWLYRSFLGKQHGMLHS